MQELKNHKHLITKNGLLEQMSELKSVKKKIVFVVDRKQNKVAKSTKECD